MVQEQNKHLWEYSLIDKTLCLKHRDIGLNPTYPTIMHISLTVKHQTVNLSDIGSNPMYAASVAKTSLSRSK